MTFDIQFSPLPADDGSSHSKSAETFHKKAKSSIFGSDEYGVGTSERDNSTPLPPSNSRMVMLRQPFEDLVPGSPTGSRNERRRIDRLHGRLPVVISIVFPQETFTPFIEETHVMNINTRGAMGKVTFPEAVLRKVIKEEHYCRLQFGMDTLPQRILGKVLWYSKCPNETTLHNIGVKFDQLSDHDLIKLGTFMNLIMPSSEADPSSPTVNCVI